MIEVKQLEKRYGAMHAVRHLDFKAYPGEVLGLLGPNGAGKSTSIKAITGMIRPTRGQVYVAGFDMLKQGVQAKAHLGYVPDRPYLYQKLSARELLRFLVQLRRIEDGERDMQAWLEFFSLSNVANELIETFSHGMRQKLTFITALLHKPKVLVIDEPMVGLDPRAAKQVRQLMRDYADKGNTVLLTTHSMEVAQAVTDRVLLISQGAAVAEGNLEQMRQHIGNHHADLEAIFLQLTQEQNQELLTPPDMGAGISA